MLGDAELNPGLLRTTVRGPRGATMWIDVTPAEAPGFDTGKVAVRTDRRLSGGVREIVFSGGGPEFCTGGACALYQLDYGDAGIAIIAGPSATARAAARRVAMSAEGNF